MGTVGGFAFLFLFMLGIALLILAIFMPYFIYRIHIAVGKIEKEVTTISRSVHVEQAAQNSRLTLEDVPIEKR